MADYITLEKNLSLLSFKEPVKGFINGYKNIEPVPVVTVGELIVISKAELWERVCPVIADKYKIDASSAGINTLLRFFKPDHPMAVYRDKEYNKLCITPLGQPDRRNGITVIDELFLDPLVKIGNSYIELLKTFIRSAKVEGLVCLTSDEEVELGLMDGDEIPHDEDDRPIYLGCVTDDPKIQNDEAQVLCGSYDLYIHKDESIEMIWGPNEIDGSYKGIGAIIDRLFDFSTLNPNNQR